MIFPILNRFSYFILFFSVLLGSNTTSQGEAYEYFIKGEYALLHKDYSQAESYFSKALLLAPYSPTILQSLGDLKSYQGEYADAIKYLEIIIELAPENKETGMKLFQLYIQDENQNDAYELLDTLLKYHLDDIELLYSRSNLQYLNHDWPNLLKTYHSIYLSDPDNMDILLKIYEIGLATDHISIVLEIIQDISIENETPLVLELLVELFSGKNEFTKAIFYIKKLMDIDENTDQRTISMAELYLLNEQFEYVIATLKPMYQSGNHSLEVLRLLLIAFSTIEKYEEQIAISLTLTEKYPEMSIGYEALAFAYLDDGDEVSALNILHQALNKFPDEVIFPHIIANIYYQSKNYYEAEKYFLTALDVNPKVSSIQHTMAIMFEDMADTDRSDSLFLYLIEKNENDAIGLNDYAYIISERKESSPDDLHYALELAGRAISIEPDNAAFLDTIGWIYFKMGIYDKAQKYLEKSLKINEDNPVILEHMGDIYRKVDASDQALLVYERAYLKDTDNKILQDKIDQIDDK